ncbi:hypothetical protein FACS1894139_08220 [Planctomycetales bacterium]|nr:hypothetical protein FACS1894107_00040 [Planctomycetales bacterium]GHS96318.1 hypothetical protein FACS1894108_00740 [Planctomycetales bacterium]GHT05051.1 hypothetical protein FACS1894139_08220 [Planctomycetales bacterium]GHV19372.1 hypothetical protein AGMMS49959_04130 [Planctomycetales bacterium]
MNNEKKSIYIESTIPSYATARPSRDTIAAGQQAITKLFWERQRHNYNLFTSQDVIDECKRGDAEAAQRRLDFMKGIEPLGKSEKVARLAAIYQDLLQIPDRAKTDCFHLANCVIARIDYLLTWNCTHLGAKSQFELREYNERHGLWTPYLVTPNELIEIKEEGL